MIPNCTHVEPVARAWQDINPHEQPLLLFARGDAPLPGTLQVSASEQARAARLRQKSAQQAFLRQHHLLRTFLAHWLDQPAARLDFACGAQGKPVCRTGSLHFNLSRSGTLLAFYFGAFEGGVDIEARRSAAPFAELAAQHFHPQEQALATDDDAFFTLWTRKEALLKAHGCGLLAPLSAIDCTGSAQRWRERDCRLHTWLTDSYVLSLGLLDTQARPDSVQVVQLLHVDDVAAVREPAACPI